MQPFICVTGVAAPIAISNINTDIIAPKALLRKVTREGMGGSLFGPYRYDQDGLERADFVLNQTPFRQAKIIVALENFGCGSSREHAAWALLDFGVRVVIAASFAEIFVNNSFKSGLLPITLPLVDVERVMTVARTGREITVDLPSQSVRLSDGEIIAFSIDPVRKAALLRGLDDIQSTLDHEDVIAAFEATQFDETPWLRAGLAPQP